MAAALETDRGRNRGRVAAAVGVLRLGVGLLRRREFRIERSALRPGVVVLQVGGFDPPVAFFAVAVVGPGLRMADLTTPGVVLFEARADRGFQTAALKDAAFRFGLDVHHLLFPGRGVAQPLGLGA